MNQETELQPKLDHFPGYAINFLPYGISFFFFEQVTWVLGSNPSTVGGEHEPIQWARFTTRYNLFQKKTAAFNAI